MTTETLLLRQINPSFIQQGRPTSQAFRPTPKDRQMVSVYDGDLIDAQAAWVHFTSGGFRSVGVLAVSVAECRGEGLEARPDPVPFPEHAVIDFLEFTGTQAKKRAERLRERAVIRNWLYQAVDDSSSSRSDGPIGPVRP